MIMCTFLRQYPTTKRAVIAARFLFCARFACYIRRMTTSSKPKLALLSDVQGWAFCQQMHDLEEYLAGRFDIEHLYVFDWVVRNQPVPDLSKYDALYCPYHRWNIGQHLPWRKTLGSLRAQWLFPENKRVPQSMEFEVVNRFRAFNVVNRANYAEYAQGCPNLHYLTNPVNMRRFPQQPTRRDTLVASWNGNAGHSNSLGEDVKGFHSIVVPACAQADVPLVYAEYNTCRKAPAEMPAFYQQANVALSASLYEGASSSVMEAMAAGLALVVTDCGNHREIRDKQLTKYGESGIRVVERSVGEFVRELRFLKDNPDLAYEMGQLNRRSIAEDWSWDVWAGPFERFLSIPLETQP
jgi:hypothetical protein